MQLRLMHARYPWLQTKAKNGFCSAGLLRCNHTNYKWKIQSQVIKGPYDLSLVEGSITTPHDAERIHQVRRQSKYLITIGACAPAVGIQALRNFKDVKDLFQ